MFSARLIGSYCIHHSAPPQSWSFRDGARPCGWDQLNRESVPCARGGDGCLLSGFTAHLVVTFHGWEGSPSSWEIHYAQKDINHICERCEWWLRINRSREISPKLTPFSLSIPLLRKSTNKFHGQYPPDWVKGKPRLISVPKYHRILLVSSEFWRLYLQLRWTIKCLWMKTHQTAVIWWVFSF